MSLQYYDISLAVNESKEFSAQGRYVYYLAGTTPLITGGVTPAAAGNQAIRIKPAQGGGGEIILMPGQSMRLPDDEKAPSAWRITNYKQAEAITGTVLIGEGEFVDNNTANTFKLDATFANTVKVTNDTSTRVPVSLDTNQVISVAGSTVQYTNSFADAGIAAIAGQQIFAAASNPNGAYIEFAEVAMSAAAAAVGTTVSLIAKASPPGSQTDGDVLMVVNCSSGSGSSTGGLVNQILGQRIKIPAGKGLYLNQLIASTGAERCNKTVLYTLL